MALAYHSDVKMPSHFAAHPYTHEEDFRMPTEQRTQKRTPATVALQVSSAKQPLITELAFTENVSLRGVRVVTVRAWKPGEHVIVKSYRGTVQSRATVIYCHNLAKMRYAVGLELHSAVGTWVDILEPPRVDA